MNLRPTTHKIHFSLTIPNLKGINLKAQWLLPLIATAAIELPQTVNSVISIKEYVTSQVMQTALPSKAPDDCKSH